jgi:hypothetical protein
MPSCILVCFVLFCALSSPLSLPLSLAVSLSLPLLPLALLCSPTALLRAVRVAVVVVASVAVGALVLTDALLRAVRVAACAAVRRALDSHDAGRRGSVCGVCVPAVHSGAVECHMRLTGTCSCAVIALPLLLPSDRVDIHDKSFREYERARQGNFD